MDWELSTESLEDNIEGADLEDHIARLMATQAGNDIEEPKLVIDKIDITKLVLTTIVGERGRA